MKWKWKWKCNSCDRETVASFQPYCVCERGLPMTEVKATDEPEEKLPKVIQMEIAGGWEVIALLDDGTMQRRHLGENGEWELFKGPPCTLPKNQSDSSETE